MSTQDPLLVAVLDTAARSIVARERRLAIRVRARWSPAAALELSQARESLASFLRGMPSDDAESLALRAQLIEAARGGT